MSTSPRLPTIKGISFVFTIFSKSRYFVICYSFHNYLRAGCGHTTVSFPLNIQYVLVLFLRLHCFFILFLRVSKSDHVARLGSSNPPASVSQVARTAFMYHHAQH